MSIPPGNCSDGELKLADPIDSETYGTREGRVEICINNAWGTVCNNAFNIPDALVACEQLVGFQSEGIILLLSTFNYLYSSHKPFHSIIIGNSYT